MFSHRQIACLALAGLLLLALPAAAQLEAGDLNMNLNGNLAAGYSGSYGNQIDSTHSLNWAGSGNLAGYYYSPNFVNFNFAPYYDQSRANSTSQSITDASGFDISSGIFGGSHFPGSINYARSYNSEGNYAVPGVGNFTTHGNSETFGINWSEILPDMPSLSVGFGQGSSQYSIFGTNDNGEVHNHSFNVRSGYLIGGFNLSAYYTNSASNSTFPELFGSSVQNQTTTSSGNGEGFAISHRTPLRGVITTSFNRSEINSDYLGYNYNGTVDTANATVSVQPINKLHVTASANYDNNLTGLLYQSIVPAGTAAPLPNNSSSSHAWDLEGSGNYEIIPNLQAEASAQRREQTYFGQSYGGNTYGAGLIYSHSLLGGTVSSTFFLLDNTLDHSDANTLGFTAAAGYNRRFGAWSAGGSFSYAQNVQTLLVSYTNSYYNYSANIRRKFQNRFSWTATASGSRTALSAQPSTANSSQSYGTGFGYRQWISLNGSYTKSTGEALQGAGGLITAPILPVIPENLLVFFGGNGYSVGVSSTPVRKLTITAAFSHANSNTLNAGLGTWNRNEQWNMLV